MSEDHQEEGLAHGGEGGGDGGLAEGDNVEGAADGGDGELGRDHRPHHARRPGSHPLGGLKHPGMNIWYRVIFLTGHPKFFRVLETVFFSVALWTGHPGIFLSVRPNTKSDEMLEYHKGTGT